MTRVSTSFAFLLAFLICGCAIAYAADTAWPLHGDIDLSSGFGDFREGRFHAGVDIRTGGAIGKEVYSPVDGWVLRVKMSYTGYGKGLYVKGDDGFIYVFGHLSAFEPKLDRLVKTRQNAIKRYYIELNFPADSLRVKKGQLLAYSGQTGAGAPHLHIEKRTADNYPLNPLTHGFTLPDKISPVFTRVGFQMTDDRSLLETGRREEFLPVRATGKGNRFVLDRILYLNKPFGLLVDCYDTDRPEGMKQSVYKLSVRVDGKPFYQVIFDTLDYATGRAADLEYDLPLAEAGDREVRRLFRMPGDDFAGSRQSDSSNGTFGSGFEATSGRHSVVVEASDAAGNKSELTLRYLWGPPKYIYTLDSSLVVNDTTTDFYFTPTVDPNLFGIDSIKVFVNVISRWGTAVDCSVAQTKNGHLIARVVGRGIPTAVLALFAYSGRDSFRDIIFSGMRAEGPGHIHLGAELVDDGLLVNLESRSSVGARPRIELYYKGNRVGTEYAGQFFNVKQYRWLVPPLAKYRRVDMVGGVLSSDSARLVSEKESVQYAVVGLDSLETLTIDSLFVLHVGRANFFTPRFLEISHQPVVLSGALQLGSDVYKVLPDVFPLRQDIDITLKPSIVSDQLPKCGLCRLDDKGEKWIWLGGMGPDSLLHGKTNLGGSFAAVFDLEPPVIESVNVPEGHTVMDSRPAITFTLKDNLSGFEDDRNILIKLDGKWMIPEYDPETKICQTQPLDPLEGGQHHLSIEVTDRAGNEGHRYLKFSTPLKQK